MEGGESDAKCERDGRKGSGKGGLVVNGCEREREAGTK